MVGDPRRLAPPGDALHHPRSLAAFRNAKLLTGGYLSVSVLALAAIALLHGDAAAVNNAVWVRGSIVAVSALVTYLCAVRAARGSRGAYRRLRVICGVMLVAIAVIVALPGPFPVWMKIEQGACGLLLLGAAVVVNGRWLRSVFAAR